jgi:hypothetical protein
MLKSILEAQQPKPPRSSAFTRAGGARLCVSLLSQAAEAACVQRWKREVR